MGGGHRVRRQQPCQRAASDERCQPPRWAVWMSGSTMQATAAAFQVPLTILSNGTFKMRTHRVLKLRSEVPCLVPEHGPCLCMSVAQQCCVPMLHEFIASDSLFLLSLGSGKQYSCLRSLSIQF